MSDSVIVDGGALRFNNNKLDLSYCPLSTKIAVATVFASNSEKNGGKYPDFNWVRGQSWSTPLASATRHMELFASGEDIDKDSGIPHLWLAQANLAMLIEYATIFKEGDDRLATRNIPQTTFDQMITFYQNALKKNEERSKT